MNCLRNYFAGVLILACQTSLCMAEVPRVALMPSGHEKAKDIVALMEVELAAQNDVVILERKNLDRILTEHKLALNGLLSSDDAFVIGKLLACDVFAEFHFQDKSADQTAICVLTAFDAITGVRLCDATIEASGSVDTISEAADKILLEALQRRNPDIGSVSAITLLSLRNVDLPLKEHRLLEIFRPMFERQLLRSPEITVLERKRLNQVNQEAALTGEMRDHLLASSVLLDVDFSRGKKAGEVSIRGVVSNHAGKEIAVFKFAHDGADAEGLVSTLTQRLLRVMHLSPVIASGKEKRLESNRFSGECKRLLKQNRSTEALTAAECAHALSPQDVTIQAMLCNVLESKVKTYLKNKKYEEALVALERAWAFREKWRELGESRWTPYPTESLRFMLEYKNNLSAEQQSRFLKIRHLYRQWWQSNPYKRVYDIDIWTESADEWMDAVFEFIPNPFGHISLGSSRFRELSKDRKQKLMELYKQSAKKDDPWACITCISLARQMPDAFEDATGIIQGSCDQLVNMAIQEKSGGLITIVGNFLYSEEAIQGLPRSISYPVAIRLQEEIDKRKVVSPALMKYFEWYARHTNGQEGSYTAEVARKLVSGYGICSNRYEGDRLNGDAEFPDILLAQCKYNYKRLTGSKLSIDDPRATEHTSYWERQKKIFEVADTEKWHSSIQGVAQRDNLVFLAVSRRGANPHTTLVECNLDSGDKRVVSTIEDCVIPNHVPSHEREELRSDMSVGERAVCLPGRDGVIIFPRNGDTPCLLRSGKDLPNAAVVAAIEIDSSLYLACERRFTARHPHPAKKGEVYLVDIQIDPKIGLLLKCDMNGKNQEILASSDRKESHSPLDNCDPYYIEGFLWDKAKSRLFFMITCSCDEKKSGIWGLDLKSGTFSQVMHARSSIFMNFAPQKDGTIWFCYGFDVVSWDPVEEKITKLIVNPNWTKKTDVTACFWMYRIDNARCAAIVNDVMYLCGRDPVTYRFTLTYFNKGLAKKGLGLEPFIKFPPIFLEEWQGRLVAANKYALWLLKPGAEKSR